MGARGVARAQEALEATEAIKMRNSGGRARRKK